MMGLEMLDLVWKCWIWKCLMLDLKWCIRIWKCACDLGQVGNVLP